MQQRSWVRDLGDSPQFVKKFIMYIYCNKLLSIQLKKRKKKKKKKKRVRLQKKVLLPKVQFFFPPNGPLKEESLFIYLFIYL